MVAVAEEKPIQPVEKPVTPKVAAVPATSEYTDDDPVCVILRGWGTPELPVGKLSYLGNYTATGGVIRNIPYAEVKKLIKLGMVSKEHVFPNNAQPADFAERMGRDPLAPGTVAAALTMLTPEKIAAILGDEAAERLARALLSEVKSREGGA